MAPTSYACRYCKRSAVARSLQGLKSHISQSAKCRARRDEEYTLLRRTRSAQDGTPHTQQPTEHHGQQEEGFEGTDAPHPDDSTDDHRSKRARVDDSDDDENFQPTNINFIVDYPEDARAGAILEDTNDGLETRFEKIRRTQQVAGKPAWAPFDSLKDWELSRWLIRSGVSQSEIDKFLKLEAVRMLFVMPAHDVDSLPRLNPALRLPEASTHFSRKSIVSPRAQSGHAKSSKLLGTARMRAVKPSSRKLSCGEGIRLSVCGN
jgi:hypothetical protein